MTDLKSVFTAPEAIMSDFHQGLALIAEFDEKQQRKVISWVRSSSTSGRWQSAETIATEIGISQDHAAAVQVAVAIMVRTLTTASVSREDFIGAGLEHSAFSQDQVSGLSNFVDLVVAARPELQEKAKVVRLQNAVLPTLTNLELALDVRVHVSNGDLIRSVPVVLAYADTDSEGQVIWFQMDETTVRAIRDDLSSMLEQIEALTDILSNDT